MTLLARGLRPRTPSSSGSLALAQSTGHFVPVVAPRPDTTVSTDLRDLARGLAGPAVVAVAVELVLLRLVTRTAIHIPGIEAVAGPYRVVASAGRFASYAASVLVACTTALVAWQLARHGRRWEAAAAGATVIAALLARLGLLDTTTLGLVIGVAVALLAVHVARGGSRLGPAVGLFGAAFLASAIHGITQGLAGEGTLQPPSTTGLLLVAETLLVVAVLALPRAVAAAGGDRIAGAAAGVLVFAAFAASSSTTKILMLWTFGLAGYFPAVVYAVVVGFLATALRAAWRSDRDVAAALAFLAAGGIGLTSSYQSTLVVCGLALLVLSCVEKRRHVSLSYASSSPVM